MLDANTIASAISVPSSARDIRLRLGPDLAQDLVPFVVGQTGGVVPRLGLAVEAGVGPQVMAVRGEVQALGIGGRGSG